jgi:hypothetical protein
MKHRYMAKLLMENKSAMPTCDPKVKALLNRLSGKDVKNKKKTGDMINYMDADSPAANSKPSDRQEGSGSLSQNYAARTPGSVQESNKDQEDYRRWKKLVNMSPQEIQQFLDSDGGKVAGLSRKQASNAGSDGGAITSGRDSARAIIRMKQKPFAEWDADDMKWMRKQISFISRMSGNPGKLRDENGKPTRKLLSLRVWGHNPGGS